MRYAISEVYCSKKVDLIKYLPTVTCINQPAYLPEITTGDRPLPVDVDNTTDSCPQKTSTEPELSTEASLWCYPPLSMSLVAQNEKARFNETSFDICFRQKGNPDKDIGEYQFRMPTEFPLPLESCEREALKKIRKVIRRQACVLRTSFSCCTG